MKRTEGARGVGLFATLGDVAEGVAVVALGIPVGVDSFLNLELLREEEEGREEFLYVVGVDGDKHRSGLFRYSSSSVLVEIPGRTELDRFRVEDGRLDEGNSWSSSSGRTSMGTECIACCIPVGPRENDSQGEDPVGYDWLMPGDGIEVGGVGFGGDEGVSAGEGYCASVIDLDSKTFVEEAVGICESGGNDVREGCGNAGCLGVGYGSLSDGKETTGGEGEGGRGF